MSGPGRTHAAGGQKAATDGMLAPARNRISDPDGVRAALTARLLGRLTAQLGFRLADTRVRVDDEAARRTGPRGASGLLADGVIWLHPGRYDPATPAGRALLAHEATHLAQRRAPQPPPAPRHTPAYRGFWAAQIRDTPAYRGSGGAQIRDTPAYRGFWGAQIRDTPAYRGFWGARMRDTPAYRGFGAVVAVAVAEAEAAAAAADFAQGRELRPPVVWLPDGVAAADTGAATVPASTPVPAAKPAAPPTIGEAYAREIATIRDRLQAGLLNDVDEADVSSVLAILDQFKLGTAISVMVEVGEPFRERLADHLAQGHRRRHRQSVLASYGAMTRAERARRGPRLLDGMPLVELPPGEHATLIEVLRDLSDQTLQRLLDGDLRGRILALMQTPVEAGALTKRFLEAYQALQARIEAGAGVGDDQRLKTIITQVGQLMASPNAERVRGALTLFRPLVPVLAPGGDRTPTARPRSPEMAFVVHSLEQTGAIATLIDKLPEEERVEGNPYGGILLEIIRHRPVAANLANLQELLSFGFFDWLLGRRGGKAWLAYQIVRRLPPEEQQRWRRLDNGDWYRRLEDNIPEERREGYEGIVLEPDPDGRLVDVASRIADTLAGPAGRKALRQMLDACKAGIDEAHAPGLLIRFNSIGEELTAKGTEKGIEKLTDVQRRELRRAVAMRLDQLGLLGKIFAALPDRWLAEIDNLTLVRGVAALREPEHLRRQVYALIRRNWWKQVPIISIFVSEWSVSARDAFVAFQLARLLPEEDRRELEASGHWGAMVSAMTPEMRQASGMHLFADRDGKERERVIERLRDNRLWERDRAAELRVLVRMAIELGQRRFVFDRSRETRAFTKKPELTPMVEQFKLYSEPNRKEYEPERLPVEEAPQDLWGVLRRAGGWLWVKLRALGSLLGSLRVDVNAVGVENLDLNEVQRLLGGHFGPAVLDEGEGGSRRNTPPDAAAAVATAAGAQADRGGTPRNRLTLLYNPRDGALWFELPELQITSLNQLNAGLGIKTNQITVRGLRAWATFPAQRLDTPTALRLVLPEAEVVDLLVTGQDLLIGITRVVLRQLDLNLSRTGIEEPVPAPPGSDVGLPIPIIGPLVSFIVDVVRRLDYYERTKRAATQLQGLRATIDSIEFEGVAFGAGITAKKAQITDILLGAGLNRKAYLLALREVLRRRLARATARAADPKTRGALEDRIGKADAALRALDNDERRLAELRAKYVKDPASLSDDERKEAAGLEREHTGGAVVDIGRLELEGLGGDAQLDRLALTGITGDVESPLFGPSTAPLSSAFVTDAERIAEFRRLGPQRPPGVTGPVALPVRAEEAVVTGVSYVGDIPSRESLAYQLEKLPSRTPDENRNRLAGLVKAVGEYEKLEDRARGRAEPPLTAEDRRELAREKDRLQRVFGFRAAQVRAQGVGVEMLFGPALSDLVTRGGGAESFTATDVEYGGYFRAEKVTGREVGATLKKLPPERPGGPERRSIAFHAEDLHVHGAVIDWAGNKVAEVGISGLEGEIEPRRPAPDQPPAGYRIPSLTAVSATVAGIDYRTDTMWVHSDGVTTITGISLAADLERTADGSITRVHRLHLNRVSANHLILERNGPGTPFRAEITSGALLNIDVQDYVMVTHATAPAEQKLQRRFELGGLDELRFNVALGALGGGSGVLSSVTETGTPRQTGMLVVQALADSPEGGEQIDLNGLLLTGAEVHTASGRVAIRKLGIGASVHHSGDTWTIRSLTIPELRLGELNWRTADGAEISSTGGAGLTDMRVRGSIFAPAGQPVFVQVDELRIDAITAQHLRYHQDPIDIVVGTRAESSRAGQPPLEIRDIRLRDFGWTLGSGVVSGTLDVGSAAVEFQSQLAKHLQVGATVRLTSLHAVFLRGGHIVLRARGSADADVHWEEPAAGVGPRVAKQEVSAHVAVNELDTGIVDISSGAIEFGPGEQPGLQIADIVVNQVNYRSPDIVIETMPGGSGATIRRPHAKLRIELRNAAERKAAGGAEASAIKRIVLREIGIDSIELDGLKVTLPTLVPPDPSGAARKVEIWLPPGEVGILRNLKLALPERGAEIAAPPSPTGKWTIPDLYLQISGTTEPSPFGTGKKQLPALLIPQIRTTVGGILDSGSARLETERIEVGILSGGGITLDLRRPSITAIAAIFQRTPLHSLLIHGLGLVEPATAGGVSAQRATFDTRTGLLTLTELGLTRLRYRNEAAGVEVDVDKATLPGEVRTTLPGKGRELSGTIPELNIHGAYFRVDFTAGVTSTPTGPAPSATPWTDLLTKLGPYQQVFDSMQGKIKLTLHQTKTGWFRTDTPLDLAITDGQLDYHQIEVQLIRGWRGLVNFQLHKELSELWLVLETHSNQNGVDVTTTMPVAVWNLTSSELTQADPANQIRIWRLLNVEGALRTSELDVPPKPSTGPGAVELHDIDVDLSLRSAKPIPIDLGKASGGKVTGAVTLATNALSNLRLYGNLPGTLAQDKYGIASAKVDATEINLVGAGAEIRTGAIVVNDVSDLSVNLSPSWEPQVLTGRIKWANAKNITWRLP